MKIKRTLCGVSLVALLVAGVSVFVAFPVHLDGQNANSQFSPDVNDLFAKRTALVNDSGDFNKMLQSLGASSPNLVGEMQISGYADTGTEMIGNTIWFLATV